MNKLTYETLKNFTAYLFENEKSLNTVKKYERDITAFIKWLGKRELTKATVIEYKAYICERYAPRSVNSMLSSLNALFGFMDRFDLKVKALKIQRSVFSDKSRELTKKDYERLLETARKNGDTRLYYLMQAIGATGIRISELEFITVEALRGQSAVISCKGKLRYLLIPGRLCQALLKYARDKKIKSGPVFVSKNGKPLNRVNVWRMLKALCEEANVPKEKVFPHNFRHLFARTFYSLEKDIVRLADVLGHSNINTTRIYTVETGEIHARQLERLGLLIC